MLTRFIETNNEVVYPAIYRHYTGKLYLVHSLSYSATDSSRIVHYQSLTDGTYWSSTVSEFTKPIQKNETGNTTKQERTFCLEINLGESIVPDSELLEVVRNRGYNIEGDGDSSYMAVYNTLCDKNNLEDFTVVQTFSSLGSAREYLSKHPTYFGYPLYLIKNTLTLVLG